MLRKASIEECRTSRFFYRECALAEKENAKIEKMTIEDGDGERLWELSERCLEMLPAQI